MFDPGRGSGSREDLRAQTKVTSGEADAVPGRTSLVDQTADAGATWESIDPAEHAGGGVVPHKRLEASRRLVARAATVLGVDEPPVRMDELARARAEAHATDALLHGDVVLLHPERFDPETAGAFTTVVHELVHVAQRKVPKKISAEYADAESEAAKIADQVSAGQKPDQPVVHLGAREAADGKKPVTPVGEPELPANADFLAVGDGGEMLISVPWFTSDGADLSQTQILAPTKVPHLLRELKKKVFWWMPESAIEGSGDIWLHGPITAKKVMRTSLAPGMFSRIGLPPGTDVDWLFENGKGYEIIRSSVLPYIRELPDDWIEHQIPEAIEDLSERRLYKKAGVRRPGISMVMDRKAKLRKTEPPDALVIEYPRENMETLLGKERWKQLTESKEEAAAAPASSPFGGLTFDNSLSIEDREYFLEWAKRVYGSVPAGMGTPVDAAIILTLRKIDAHPLKEKILAAFKQSSPDGTKLDWVRLDRLVHDFEQAEIAAKYGNGAAPPASGTDQPAVHATPTKSEGPRARFYERPISGDVVNLGSLASVGKELELYFATTDPQGIGFVSVNVHWFATLVGSPDKRVREGRTHHFAHHSPEKWKVSFDKVGTYQITAHVDHDSYWPRYFDDTIIEVKTEQERLDEVETAAFTDLGKNTSRVGKQEFFEVSWSNDRLGDDKYTFGDLIEGDVPADFKHRTLEERVKFFADDRAKLEALIKRYEGERKEDRGAKDIISYAKNALATLDSTKARIDTDGKDLMPFEIRGAFLSEKNGVRSGTMNLVGLAGKRAQTVSAGGVTAKVADRPTVRIHDLSQLYEPKNAVYTGQNDNFREAIEDAFVDLCKSYPPGRVSVLFEQLGEDYKPNGKTMGFELHTGTKWKDVKETVWDGKVQLVVNIAAAAASVFIPGAALVIMPFITAYNAVDTLDNLAALQRKGQATTKHGFEAGLSIGLDILPFLGKMTKAGKFGGKTLFALDVAQTTTNVIVMTDTGLAEVAALRDGHIKDIALLTEEIEEIRRVNDSDPRIRTKEAELQTKIETARAEGARYFKNMAASGAVMLMAPMAFNHLINGIATKTARELETSGMFVHEKGVEPHYKPETGKIHGDRARVDDVKLKALQDAYLLDVYRQHADVANLLGVKPENVVITRKQGQPRTTVAQNKDGVYEVTAPEHHPHDKILDDVWNQRAKSSTAPAERPAKLVGGDYTPVFDGAEVAKIGKPIVVGRRIESPTDAEAIMQGLAAGDRKALKKIGVDLPKDFNPSSVEWGLGRLPDGQYVIIRGSHGDVNWGPFPEITPLAHTHPMRANKMLKSDGGRTGIHVSDLVIGKGANYDNRLNFFPSAADIGFTARMGLAVHAVHTPYVHIGNKMVGNPVGDFADKPRITFEISQVQRVGSWEGLEHIPAYKAELVARDASGVEVWKGPIYAVDHPAGSFLEAELPARWTKQADPGVTPPAGAPPPRTTPSGGKDRDLGRSDHDGHVGTYVAEKRVNAGSGEAHHVRVKRLDDGSYIVTLCSRCTRIENLAKGAITYLEELIKHPGRAPHAQPTPADAKRWIHQLAELEGAAKALEARSKNLSADEIDSETNALASKIEELAAHPALEPVLAIGSAEVKPLGVDIKPTVDAVMARPELDGDTMSASWIEQAKKLKGEALPNELAQAALGASKNSPAIEAVKKQQGDPDHAARVEREARKEVVDEYLGRLETSIDATLEAHKQAKTHKSNPGLAATQRVKDAIDNARARAHVALTPEWRYTNAGELEARIANMNAADRIAFLKPIAKQRADAFGWTPARRVAPNLAARNSDRTLYADEDGNVFSLDTQHGRFEVHDLSGKHLREVNMDGAETKPRDASGGHDLRKP